MFGSLQSSVEKGLVDAAASAQLALYVFFRVLQRKPHSVPSITLALDLDAMAQVKDGPPARAE
jgi:hypothetical protein